jgi:hypothetical protein
MEFVYTPATHVVVRLREEFLGIPAGSSCRQYMGCYPPKGPSQVADKCKSKKVDKGKGKMIEQSPKDSLSHTD